ncbi:hypothetical protein VP1G_08710 [Cytospora mali]|uniref:Uncharacterized protein n=1 Tax=Cytospora mali TaxID=578113 RepID=A0A194VCN9_CYTMA|nr:hypothetical protein VP1G_08710 [Valsa mali var. pyri (nom. inval.)]
MPTQASPDEVSEVSEDTGGRISYVSVDDDRIHAREASTVERGVSRRNSAGLNIATDPLLNPDTAAHGNQDNHLSQETIYRYGSGDNYSETIVPGAIDISRGAAVKCHSGYSSLGPETRATWLPFTLRLPFLILFIATSLVLGEATFAITIYSQINNGLGVDNGSSALLFGWRFTPTLVAVLYALCTATLLVDIRRTETYARLTRPQGASAQSTVCAGSRYWWNDPIDALNKKKFGSRSWILFCASSANIAAFLVISPLSAGLLAPVDADVSRASQFTFLDMPSSVDFPTGRNDTMILRTIAGGVLNSSASAWVMDDYYIKPFWPSSSSSWPLGASFAADGTEQEWTATTTAYSVQLNCSEVSLKSARNMTGPELYATGFCDQGACTNESMQYGNYADLELVSDDGCSISIYRHLIAQGEANSYKNLLTWGGGWWTNSFTNLSWDDQSWSSNVLDPTAVSNASSGCGSRSYISFNTPWTSNESLVMNGYVCSSVYWEADVTATVAVSNISTELSIDPDEFRTKQRRLDSSLLDVQRLEDSFFRANWESHFPTGYFAGPSQAVASMYDNSTQELVTSGNILDDARKMQQRWLGEMLLSTQSAAGQKVSTSPGWANITVKERKIVVVEGIGLVIGGLLNLAALKLVFILFKSRLQRRPLGLHCDPATIAAATSLIASDSSSRMVFSGKSRSSGEYITKSLRHVWWNFENGSLRATLLDPLLRAGESSSSGSIRGSEKETQGKDEMNESAPTILRIWMGLSLLATLIALIAVLAALYILSQTVELRQHALVYEAHVQVARIVTNLAPYSIIPTLIAVGVKLWYGAVERTLRRLQPFSAMTNQPRSLKDSVLVEYANSPLILGSIKAMRHSDWILAFACLGGFGTEIFTVGISALWDKEAQLAVHPVKLKRQLELREVPTVIGTETYGSGTHTYSDPTIPSLLNTVYGNYLTSWLYGGLLETMQATSTPSWSMDEWSFAPIDFSLSSEVILKLSSNATTLDSLLYNITVETPALRARLNCTQLPEDAIQDDSNWLSTWDFKNDKGWNETNSPPGLNIGYELKGFVSVPNLTAETYIIPQRGTVQCCANETDGVPGEAAIGYGTTMGGLESSVNQLFVKWIVGKPLEGLYFDSNSTTTDTTYAHWIWAEKPQMQGITCSPMIEQANASVTVDLSSGTVRNYTITSEPQDAKGAWTDNNVARDPYTPVPENETMSGWAYNTTYSYGWMFWNGLVYSANLKSAASLATTTSQQSETDHVFNIRDSGINVDFLSYSALYLANQEKRALLDADTLIDRVSQAFGTYFKHFASDQVDSTTGGRAFQAIGATLPADLPAVADPEGKTWYNESMAVNIAPTTVAQVHVFIEALVMSTVAVYVCLAVLAFLCPIIVAIYVFYRRRIKMLPRDVDTLASVLAFVYDSPKLLEWVQDRKEFGNWDDGGMRMARLGEFRTGEGHAGWGVELVD